MKVSTDEARITRLPVWVQDLLREQRNQIDLLTRQSTAQDKKLEREQDNFVKLLAVVRNIAAGRENPRGYAQAVESSYLTHALANLSDVGEVGINA